MANKRPDIYEHNNPDLAFVDSNFVRGGRRAVANRSELYALATKADQLKQGVTVVRIASDSLYDNAVTEVLLVSLANAGSATGWELHGNGVVSPYTDEQAQDAFGELLQDSDTIQGVYDDSGNILTFNVRTDSVEESLLSPAVRAKLNLAGGDTVASLVLVGTTLQLTTDLGTFSADLSSLATSTEEPPTAGDTITAVALNASDVLRITTDRGTFDVPLATFRDLSKATGSLAQSQVTGLVAALAGKSNTTHTHTLGTSATPGFSTNNYNDLTNKPSIPTQYTDAQAQQANDARFDTVEADVTQLEQDSVRQDGELDSLDQRVTTLENNPGSGGGPSVVQAPGTSTTSVMSQDATTKADLVVLQQIAYPASFSGMSVKATFIRTYGLTLYRYTNDASNVTATPDTDFNAVPIGYWLTPDQRAALANVSAANPAIGQTQGDARYILKGQAGPAFTEQDTNTVSLTLAGSTLTADVNLADTVDIDLFSDSEGVKAQFTPDRKAALANVSTANPAIGQTQGDARYQFKGVGAIDYSDVVRLDNPSYDPNGANSITLDPATLYGKRVVPYGYTEIKLTTAYPADEKRQIFFDNQSHDLPVRVRTNVGSESTASQPQLMPAGGALLVVVSTSPGVSPIPNYPAFRTIIQAFQIPPAGGEPSDTFDPYDVPTAKANQVIADYASAGGPFVESDEAYYYCEFTDDYTSQGDEFQYRCTPSRPVSEGDPTVWKWRRYLETGI